MNMVPKSIVFGALCLILLLLIFTHPASLFECASCPSASSASAPAPANGHPSRSPASSLPPSSPSPLPPLPNEVHFYFLLPTLKKALYPDFSNISTYITYDDPRNPLNYPKSTWTDARNFMYFLSKKHEWEKQAKGSNHVTFHCYLDGDIELDIGTLHHRLQGEREYDYIIAPDFKNHRHPQGTYRSMQDAGVNCFNTVNLERFLPYCAFCDSVSWRTSQYDLFFRARLRTSSAFKIYEDLEINNPRHTNYPKGRDFAACLSELYKDDWFKGRSAKPHPKWGGDLDQNAYYAKFSSEKGMALL